MDGVKRLSGHNYGRVRKSTDLRFLESRNCYNTCKFGIDCQTTALRSPTMSKATTSKTAECTLLELRAQLSDVISRVKVSGDPIIITQYAKPQVALVSLEDLALIQSIKKNKA